MNCTWKIQFFFFIEKLSFSYYDKIRSSVYRLGSGICKIYINCDFGILIPI